MAKRIKTKPIKAIIILCEGKTDVAFLRRLLTVDSYRDYKEVVGNMPNPLGLGGNNNNKSKGSYFINKLRTYQYDSANLRDLPILPLILRRTQGVSDTYAFLYDMNGMDRVDNYKEIIRDFQNLSRKSLQPDDFAISHLKMDVALAFVYDIDDKSSSKRVEYIKETFSDTIEEIQYLREDKSIIDSKHFKGVGYYFLCDEQSDKGNLEDLILPLMKKGKEDLFENAEKFLNSEGEFVRYRNTTPLSKDDSKTASDLNKSLIGSVGQIEISGLNNADIIKHTKLLDKDKFKSSKQCLVILKFIKLLRDKL
ncbi:MAG: DUF3226 domain-containing protein [Saprospiraceae bacterium]